MMGNKGFTLIEALLYLALFSIIIGGGMVAVFQIIESTDKTNQKVIIQEDANFLLRKIDWALTGAEVGDVAVDTDGKKLTKGASVFILDGTNLKFNGEVLNSSFVKIEEVPTIKMFDRPAANQINITFTVNGQRFDQVKYLR